MYNIQFQPSAIDAGGAVSSAWEQVKANYGLYLGVSLIALILAGCIPCVSLFLIGPIMGGVYYVALRDMRREPVEFGMMFKGFEKFVPLMVIGLIQSIPGIIFQVFRFSINIGQLGIDGGRSGSMDFFAASDMDKFLASGLAVVAVIGFLVFFVVSIAFWSLTFFAIPLAMENDLGPMDALKLSAKAAIGNLGGMALLLVFSILIGLVGTLMLCIGVFLVSIPLIYVTNAFVYRQVFPMISDPYNMAPPPPNEYGFGSPQY